MDQVNVFCLFLYTGTGRFTGPIGISKTRIFQVATLWISVIDIFPSSSIHQMTGLLVCTGQGCIDRGVAPDRQTLDDFDDLVQRHANREEQRDDIVCIHRNKLSDLFSALDLVIGRSLSLEELAFLLNGSVGLFGLGPDWKRQSRIAIHALFCDFRRFPTYPRNIVPMIKMLLDVGCPWMDTTLQNLVRVMTKRSAWDKQQLLALRDLGMPMILRKEDKERTDDPYIQWLIKHGPVQSFQ